MCIYTHARTHTRTHTHTNTHAHTRTRTRTRTRTFVRTRANTHTHTCRDQEEGANWWSRTRWHQTIGLQSLQRVIQGPRRGCWQTWAPRTTRLPLRVDKCWLWCCVWCSGTMSCIAYIKRRRVGVGHILASVQWVLQFMGACGLERRLWCWAALKHTHHTHRHTSTQTQTQT